jgi:putative ABC transport system permease protein
VPPWLTIAISRIQALVRRRRLDDDFDRELGSHLEMLVEDNVRRGMSADEARRAAVVRLGGVMQLKEQRREERGIPLVETTARDVRYAFRALRKNPAFSIIAVATLAIGIGAGTSVFSFVRAVLLRPLPFRSDGELVRIFETNPLKNWTRNIAAPANWADWRVRNTVFTDIAAYEQFNEVGSGATDVFLTGFGEPQGLKSLGVTGNLFTVLGATPTMGRVFTDDETYEGKGRVVILSYGAWQSVFGADPGIVGRTITLSGRGYDVVGVMPRSFFFPGRDVQVWMPVAYAPKLIAQSRRPHWLGVVARLKAGVTLSQAQQDMNGIAKQLEAEYPDTNTQMGVRLEPLHDSFAGNHRTALLMLSGAVGLLFLIVCVNIANLQLGRGVARSREFAIRRALGAGRSRLLRQLATESLVLSTIGGALGICLAAATQTMLTRYAASAVPLFAQIEIDRSVMLFALTLAIAGPVIFGVVPALVASRTGHISERTEAGSRETRPLRNLLVASEVALSIVLVVGAVLLLRSLSRLRDVDPGFVQEHAVAFTLTLPSARYPDAAARLRAFQEIERRLADQPGVQAVGATSTLALRGFTWTADSTVEGRAPTDYDREPRHASTTRGYFTAMGIRLLAGRWFAETDTRQAPPVTIVNETLARRYFHALPLDQIVGKRMTFGRPQDNAVWVEIVGVVSDEKQDGLDEPVQPTAYSAISQRMQNPLTFVVRSPEAPASVIASARNAVSGQDKDLALTMVTTLKQVVDAATETHRFRTTLLTGFAGVALLLAALGIYGVLAYFVSQRARELGIRLALGARPAEIFRLVVGQGMRPVAIGAVVGLFAAAGLTTFMQSLLFGVRPVDPPTFAVAIATLAAISFVACALPARRATRVDPIVALRDE